ncbi:hypothetical protein ACOSQ2_027206 [Xanthoceras sorbifolium]
MKILVWNVRGLGNDRTFQVLKHHVRDYNPNFVFLSETLLSHNRMELIRVHLGFSGKLVVDNVGRSGGISLFWSDDVVVNLISFSKWHVDVRVVGENNLSWRFTGIYGNPNASQRFHTWGLLQSLRGLSGLPWLIGMISMKSFVWKRRKVELIVYIL